MARFVRTLALLGVLGAGVAATPAMAASVYFGEDLGAGSVANMPNSIAARSSFLSNLASYGVEGLESVTTTGGVGSTSTLNFGATGVTGALSFATTVRSQPFNARFAAEGSNYLDTSFNRRITFNTAVQSFGLFVIDANEINNDPATVTWNNGQSLTQADIEARPFDSVDGIFRIVTERAPGVFEVLFDLGTFPARDSSAMFVGLIDAANPFTNIILINGTSGLDAAFQDGFGYDGLIVGSVPEPGTLVLLGLGLAGLAASRRRSQ